MFEKVIFFALSVRKINLPLSQKAHLRPMLSLADLNAGLECLFKVGHMGDGEDTGKVSGDRLDRTNEAIAPGFILGAKSFVDD